MACRVAGEENGAGTEFAGAGEGAVDEEGVAARSDPADYVVRTDAAVGNGDSSSNGAVLGAFDGAVECAVAAGNDGLDELGRGAEGGWDF